MQKSISKNFLLSFTLMTSATALCSCSEAPKAMVMPPASVQIVDVEEKPFKEKSNYLGTLKSRQSITLSPHIDGHITRINVTSGQIVKTGDIIMKIDSRMQSAQMSATVAAADSVESDLANAKATLSALESTLRSRQANVDYTGTQNSRYQKLLSDGAVSQSELDSWKNNHLAAQAERDTVVQQIEAQKMTIQKFVRNHRQAVSNIEAQKEQLRYHDITAPFSGVIGDIPVKTGDHVTAGAVLTTLTENHPLELYLSIPAEKASAIHKGMRISLCSTEGQQFGDSTVTFIAPTVDPNSQTVLIKSLYGNDKSELRADQTITGQIVWNTRPGLTVPTQAVTQAAGKYFVFIAKEDKDKKMVAHQVEIEVHEITGSDYQVKSGLKAGDRIVTTGVQRLAEGAPIAAKGI